MKKGLLTMLLFASVVANAQEITYKGLKFAVTDSKAKTARVVDEVSSSDATSYDVPATIVIGGVAYTVNSIGEDAFRWSKATSITLPETIDSIQYSAFYSTEITSIKLPSKLKYIGRYAFNSSKLTSIEIPSSVEEIGESAFFTCRSLTSVKINEGLTKMGSSVFYHCPQLTSAVLPESLVEIPGKVFLQCDKLTDVKISSKAISMGDAVFQGCKALQSITLPATLQTIGDEEFLECASLTSINIPANVQSIGTSLIAKTAVSEITVDAANKYFHVVDGVLYSIDNRLLYAAPQTGKTSVNVNSKCIGINGGAFWGSAVETVTLPKGMLAIDDYAFCQSSLKSINFPASLIYIGEQGMAGTQLSGELTLPENMPYVLDGAFAGNTKLTSVVIPSGVQYIMNHAFAQSKNIKSFTCLGSKAPVIDDVYEDYDSPFYDCGASTVMVPKGCTSNYKTAEWHYYLTIKESDQGVLVSTSTNPTNNSFFSGKWADMAFDVVFDEPITIVKSNPEAFLREADAESHSAELSGKVLEPDDAWYATKSGQNTLRVWGADYDSYTMTFGVDPAKVYTMVIPAGVVKNAAGETNERIVINVFGADPTGVEKVQFSSAASSEEVARYNISGQKVGKDHKGVTIIRMADGSTKKVVVK